MRAAYVRQYGDPPAGAAFGADISWWQAAVNDTADWPTALACWQDRLVSWAEFVCIRVSTGAYGVDTTWGYHAQAAGQTGYKGKLGAYHFAYPSINRDPVPEALNFARQFGRWPFDFAMLDMEDAAGFDLSDWASRWLDTVNAAITKPLTLYTAAWFTSGNMAASPGTVPLWVAHYAKGGTVDPGHATWSIPRLPSWSGPPPAVWQYDSSTPELGSLDLNIAFDPTAVGLGAGPDVPPEPLEWEKPMKQVRLPDGTVYALFGPWKIHVIAPSTQQSMHNLGSIEDNITDVNPWDLANYREIPIDNPVDPASPDDVQAAVVDALAKWQPPAPATPVDPSTLSNAELHDRLMVLFNEWDRRFPKG
jgi:GH25 family lysozyme M1 (1,4-beta-N-acetylmuramidase)